MIHIGLTGNVASGKSSVARTWSALGIPVVSADELAREVVVPGSTVLASIREEFGDTVIDEAGGLDRARMRALVFRDARARRTLESILHPQIRRARDTWLEARRAEGAELVVSEIPLLFELGLEGDFDAVVVVHSPSELREDRLVRERGLSREEAARIIGSQGDAELKRRGADYVIENSGDLEELRQRALGALARMREDLGLDPATRQGDPEAANMRIDLHLHTRGSWDCLSDPEVVLARAAEKGIDRIAVTDHNSLDVALEMAAKYPDRVIPGEEVKTAEGVDVIGLYLSTEIPKGTGSEETCLRIRDQGGLVYLPHPFARGKGRSGVFAETLGPSADIIEVFNARLRSADRNRRGAELARRHGKLRGAGSDAHTPDEVGNAWIQLPKHPNRPESLRAALPSARVHGHPAGPHVFLYSNLAKLRKRFSV